MKIAEALEIFSQTHPGMVRSHNEDSVACEPACGLVVLADGMGGYNAGEVASGIAVSVVVTEVSHRLLNASPVERVYPILIKLLAIRPGYQRTIAKSLVIT